MTVFRTHFRRRVYLMLVMMAALAVSCGSKSVLEQVEEEYAKGNYREGLYIARLHFRRGGERSPELLFLAGKSYMRLGIEAEASDSFAEVFSSDSTWAPMIAGVLKDEALESLEKGLTAKGSRFIIQAVNYDQDLDFGRYNGLAGDLMLDRKDYSRAIHYYTVFLEEYPDTVGAAVVMMDLGSAFEGHGDTLEAIQLYRDFQDRYPKSRMRSTAEWKLENLLLDSGKEMLSGGEPEEAERILGELASTAGNPLVREKANFLLAEIFESRSDFAKAVRYYTEVVNMNLGVSGRLAEKAKERIERIEAERKKNLR
ncbi:MAG: tetratricopeptide repeat protein [Candidatus Krumholzibacteria bacterium]|nr:tetratricopeptide repeat protein [Candidatus Krumholzibacteria bacterium]